MLSCGPDVAALTPMGLLPGECGGIVLELDLDCRAKNEACENGFFYWVRP